MTSSSFESGASSTQAEPFAPGSIIAEKYRVDRRLAEGGLGIVVVATQLELQRQVAIKYLKPTVTKNAVLVERFRREAQLASSIRSDHVVRIYDVGVHPDAGPYMVMEYLEGEDLGDRVERGPLEVSEAIDYIVQACDALAEAHALGIVHRDLKPDNLFVARRSGAAPTVKILDFGISKVTERRSNPNTQLPRQVTLAGTRLGTPMYMSPEQLLLDRPLDTRTDIWSLGVVLFELVTGVLPFDGDSVPHLGANIIGAPPLPLRSKLPDASPVLEAVIAKCLEKKPEDRYRNVAELVEELVSFEGRGSQPRLERIRHVVATGGESIRPPRPLATPMDDFKVYPLGTPLTVTAPAESRPPRKMKAWPFVAGAVVAIVLAIGVVARRAPSVSATASVAHAAAPPPAATTVLPTPVDAPPSATPSASVIAAPSVVPSARRPTSPPPPPRKRGGYADFGERQ